MTLGLLAAILVAQISCEAIRYPQERDAVRHHNEITTSGAKPAQP